MAYASGVLAPEESSVCLDHLDECELCRLELQSVQALIESVSQHQIYQLSEEDIDQISSNVMATVHEDRRNFHPRHRASMPIVLQWVLPVFVFVLGLWSGKVFFNTSDITGGMATQESRLTAYWSNMEVLFLNWSNVNVKQLRDDVLDHNVAEMRKAYASTKYFRERADKVSDRELLLEIEYLLSGALEEALYSPRTAFEHFHRGVREDALLDRIRHLQLWDAEEKAYNVQI